MVEDRTFDGDIAYTLAETMVIIELSAARQRGAPLLIARLPATFAVVLDLNHSAGTDQERQASKAVASLPKALQWLRLPKALALA